MAFLWDTHLDLPVHPGGIQRIDVMAILAQQNAASDRRIDRLETKLDAIYDAVSSRNRTPPSPP